MNLENLSFSSVSLSGSHLLCLLSPIKNECLDLKKCWGTLPGARSAFVWSQKSRISLGISAHRWPVQEGSAHSLTYQWHARGACFPLHCSFGDLLRETCDCTLGHMSLPFLFLWKDREPEVVEALEHLLQPSTGNRREKKNTKDTQPKSLPGDGWETWKMQAGVAALYLGVGLLFWASVQEWVSHPSSRGELLCWARRDLNSITYVSIQPRGETDCT